MNKLVKFSIFAAALAMGTVFVGCGDDSSTSSDSKESSESDLIVDTFDDLVVCSDKREGTVAYVKDEKTEYTCVDGKWTADEEESSSSSVILSGGNAEVEESSSSDSTLSENEDSSSSEEAGIGIKVEDTLVVVKRSILGVAQKGPFKFGSPVYLRELSENSLNYTKNTYTDEISSNKGDFVIPNVSLYSPYASVEVRGLYRNEMTGEYSKDSLNLFALTDLSKDARTKVNVNLLTHLEYNRAVYLVHKGYSVYAAKKQADQEIMTAFELPTTITYSEDLSVFEDSEDDNVNYANASLMMLNLLFLGDRTDAEMKKVMDNFIADFEKDGSWDDDSTKAAMADFATEVDENAVRANVKAWNILDIPAFEDQLEMFWNNVYGLGGCTNLRSGIIAQNKNTYSKNNGVYYKCTSGSWGKATTIEYDTYGWDDGESGDLKKGDVTDTVYAFNNSKWEISARETAIGLCENSNAGVISKFDDVYYICRDNAWEKATVLEYDTYGLTGVEGEVKAGVVNKDKYYVYENGTWRTANDQEVSLGVCTMEKEGFVAEDDGVYYICKSKSWTAATVLEYDTYGLTGVEGDVKAGVVNTDKYYVYENGTWRASTSVIENNLGACVTSREGEVGKSGSTYYICKSKSWTAATVLEYDTYGLTGVEGEVKAGVVNTGKYYAYENGTWRTATAQEYSLGICTTARESEVGKSGSTYYICKSKSWTAATVLEYDTYGLIGVEGDVKAGVVNTDKYYVYENGTWRSANDLEVSLGICTTEKEGVVAEDDGAYYICTSKSWIMSKDGIMVDKRDGKTYKTIVIGIQTWMAENLNYADSIVTPSLKRKSWCYENSADSCAKYGRLYTWTAAIDSVALANDADNPQTCGYGDACTLPDAVQGICPDGWHLPNVTEWQTLFTAVGGASSAGKILKSTSGWYDNGNGTDAYGFSAFPAGYRNGVGGFSCADSNAYFWSSTQNTISSPNTIADGAVVAFHMQLYFSSDEVSLFAGVNGMKMGFSVRCLKN